MTPARLISCCRGILRIHYTYSNKFSSFFFLSRAKNRERNIPLFSRRHHHTSRNKTGDCASSPFGKKKEKKRNLMVHHQTTTQNEEENRGGVEMPSTSFASLEEYFTTLWKARKERKRKKNFVHPFLSSFYINRAGGGQWTFYSQRRLWTVSATL